MNTITIICQPPNNNRNNNNNNNNNHNGNLSISELCIHFAAIRFSLVLPFFHHKNCERRAQGTEAGTSAVLVHYRIIYICNTNLYRLACITCAFLSLFSFGIFTRVLFHSDFVFCVCSSLNFCNFMLAMNEKKYWIFLLPCNRCVCCFLFILSAVPFESGYLKNQQRIRSKKIVHEGRRVK